ncbi:MAG: ATP-binding protein [Planctomycetota bacterium]|jgi:anti-sigma regulatory factor (Ser/Thr protein kinase)
MGEQLGHPALHLEMASQPRLLAAARAMVGAVGQRAGFDEVGCGQISLAVDEALCNVINHGYDRRDDGRIWVKVWFHDGTSPGLTIVIEDHARQVDPDTIRSRDLDDIRPGGLGVFIIREVMDEVRYEHRPEGGMRLTMKKHLPEGAGEEDGSVRSAPGKGEPEP